MVASEVDLTRGNGTGQKRSRGKTQDIRTKMWENELKVAQLAAAAGAEALAAWIGRVHPHEKGTRDFVTQADIASQQAVFEILQGHFPAHALVGEEGCSGDQSAVATGGPYWLVDPLDGTTNYLHQFPSYCVSLGLVVQREIVVGVVRDPLLGQTYWATRGGGAWRNGEPIRCSQCCRLSQALIAASLPPNMPFPDRNLGEFVRIVRAARSMRRTGSCALNLCYLADGRLDAYWADTVQAWDVAAGALIAAEAGACLEHRNGSRFSIADPKFIAATSPKLAQELRAELEQATPL